MPPLRWIFLRALSLVMYRTESFKRYGLLEVRRGGLDVTRS